ncbi:MAG: hypothetical protein KDB10_04640 [Acidimicrobiales bacterium]|nr:hypothetical protein [Acidimicrobiales bacterium]
MHEVAPIDICREVLADVDPAHYATYLARQGVAGSESLWLLYEEFRVMAPANAWLYAAFHEGVLDPSDDIEDVGFA